MNTGKEVDMGSPFDLFSPVSHPDCRDVTDEQFENRMTLQKVMIRNGFHPIDCEWWHFTLENEPYPDTYFDFPVSSAYFLVARSIGIGPQAYMISGLYSRSRIASRTFPRYPIFCF